jgi:hypothetical protein
MSKTLTERLATFRQDFKKLLGPKQQVSPLSKKHDMPVATYESHPKTYPVRPSILYEPAASN